MILSELLVLWTPFSVAFAALTGILLGGLVVGYFVTDPAYASLNSTPSEYGFLVAVLCALIGGDFFVGQIVAGLITDDQQIGRAASRTLLYMLPFSGTIGIGVWARARFHIYHKRRSIHNRALRERDQ